MMQDGSPNTDPTSTSSDKPSILIIGIGNLLWADEGFGVRCVEALAREWEVDDCVTIMDGGTQGLNLVDPIRRADKLIIFDAVDFDGLPGDLVLARDDEVPRFLSARAVSLHQTGFEDVLACADLLGGLPTEMLLIGCQPVELEDYGGSLRPQVKARIRDALAEACEQLAYWGVTPTPRAVPMDLIGSGLDIHGYEVGRPDEAAACRTGDERVMARLGPDQPIAAE